VSPAKFELLSKVVAWRFFSMLYGFSIAYLFTGDFSESAGIVFLTGTTLTVIQWGFEVVWDKYMRMRIRHALSREHSRVGWLVRKRRDSRDVSLDIDIS